MRNGFFQTQAEDIYEATKNYDKCVVLILDKEKFYYRKMKKTKIFENSEKIVLIIPI